MVVLDLATTSSSLSRTVLAVTLSCIERIEEERVEAAEDTVLWSQ
jgi:hypothetical protein